MVGLKKPKGSLRDYSVLLTKQHQLLQIKVHLNLNKQHEY